MQGYGHIKTKAMRNFLEKEKDRVTGYSIEVESEKDENGRRIERVFIYTNSEEWCDDSGAGTFSGDSETKAIKFFYATVRPAGR